MRARWLGLAAAVASSACAGVERPADWHASLPAPPQHAAAAGPFDAMDATAIWGVGDRVVYAVEVRGAGADRSFEFTLTTTVLPPPGDGHVLAHPVHGRVLTRTAQDAWAGPTPYYRGLGAATLRAELRGDDGTECGGEVAASRIAHWHADELTVALDEGVHELFAAVVGLDCMQAALLQVVRPPSAWSVLRAFGRVELALEWPAVDHVPVALEPTPFGPLPCAWRPFSILANGQPALDGRVQFTWKHSPLALGAGVLQVEAWHPDDAAKRVTLLLTSARRGAPPDAPPLDDLGFGLRRGMTLDEARAVLGGASLEPRERGRLADGRAVATFDLETERVWITAAVHADRLLFATAGEDLTADWLRRRGFVRDPAR